MTNIFKTIGDNAICRETHHELRSAQQRQYRMRCRVGLWISSVEKSALAIRLTANGRGYRIGGVGKRRFNRQPGEGRGPRPAQVIDYAEGVGTGLRRYGGKFKLFRDSLATADKLIEPRVEAKLRAQFHG